MMIDRLYKQARTTPAVRAKIAAWKGSARPWCARLM